MANPLRNNDLEYWGIYEDGWVTDIQVEIL